MPAELKGPSVLSTIYPTSDAIFEQFLAVMKYLLPMNIRLRLVKL
jgi:hypothetical protein